MTTRNFTKYKEFLKNIHNGHFLYKDGRIYRTKRYNNRSKKYDDLEEPEVASTLHKSSGYRRVKFQGTIYYEHRIIFILFHGTEPLKNYEAIDHINGDKQDNRIDNLEAVTIKENTLRAERMGRYKRTYGEINGMSILTEDIVRNIRYRYLQGGITQRDLAKEYNISQGHVSDIINRRKWTHI